MTCYPNMRILKSKDVAIARNLPKEDSQFLSTKAGFNSEISYIITTLLVFNCYLTGLNSSIVEWNIAQKHNLSIRTNGFSINKKLWPGVKLFTLKRDEEGEDEAMNEEWIMPYVF